MGVDVHWNWWGRGNGGLSAGSGCEGGGDLTRYLRLGRFTRVFNCNT